MTRLLESREFRRKVELKEVVVTPFGGGKFSLVRSTLGSLPDMKGTDTCPSCGPPPGPDPIPPVGTTVGVGNC